MAEAYVINAITEPIVVRHDVCLRERNTSG